MNPASGAALGPAALALFWALLVFPALVLLQAAQTLLMRLPGYGQGSIWLWIGLAGVLGAVFFTPWAFWMDALFGLDSDAFAEPDESETLITELFALAPIFLVVWLALNAGRTLRLQPDPTQSPPVIATSLTQSFWTRVPESAGRDLIALSAELHYLRVRTVQGEELILYSFGTAMSELVDSNAEGLQTHRSHWVVLRHVTRIKRVGQRAVCFMSDDSQIPVSRPYRADIEAAVNAQRSLGA